MTTISVLIVDDSAVVRGILGKAIGAEPDLELAGTAGNGFLGVQAVERHKPDVVILDIEMPVMDGREALVEIRQHHPTLPIIMFSTLTESGAADTIACMKAGASEFALKPSTSAGVVTSVDTVIRDVIMKVRALGAAGSQRKAEQRPATPQPAGTRTSSTTSAERETPTPFDTPSLLGATTKDERRSAARAQHREPARVKKLQPSAARKPHGVVPQLIVIGSSTGGPVALESLFAAIARPLPIPILLVQHMPPLFTKALADRLDSKSATTVVEATNGEPIRPGHCYVAPGSLHMEVAKSAVGSQVKLFDGPLVKSCRPAVDPLFESAAALYGAGAIGVVLTGMGSDGAFGARLLADAGSHVFTQTEDTCVVYGMPRAVDEAGHSSERLPVEQIAARLTSLTAPVAARRAA